MKRLNARRIVLALMVVGLALAVWAAPALAITWGQPDTDNVYRNVGAFMINSPTYGWYPICTGTLVHERVFLTAGHCTDYVEYLLAIGRIGPGDVAVSFDYDPLTKGAKRLPVAQVITHPDYYWGPQSDPHDVGALVLERRVRNIAPAALPAPGFLNQLDDEGTLKGATFLVAGYGGTLSWPPPEITYEDKRQYAYSEFRALTAAWLRMSQQGATDDGGTCYGDSGGPAFWVGPDGSLVLVGITSWGDAQCVSSGFDYRVDTPQTLDFVYSVIGSTAK